MQVLDKAFMSGVLVMTAFWATAVAKHPPNNSPPSDKTAKASKHPPSRLAASAADDQPASSVSPSTAAQSVADACEDLAQSSGSCSGSPAQPDSSSLVAVQVLNSLSYLQFCRMRLTAYNTLLKAVLTSVSSSAQVYTWLVFVPTHLLVLWYCANDCCL